MDKNVAIFKFYAERIFLKNIDLPLYKVKKQIKKIFTV